MTQDSGKRLGRGLSALLGGAAGEPQATPRPTRVLPIEQIVPGKFQPRRRFDDEPMQALAESVRENGVLQPILVRPRASTPITYEIVAGERRWRAAQQARLHEIPVIVRELTDREALELALVENLQRQDLTPLEEAEGYRRLLEEFGNSQDELARRVGKSRSQIANMLRLLDLPEAVRKLVEDGALTAGHARALLTAADPQALAAFVVARGLSVRQTEQLAQGQRESATRPRREKDADTRALERDLTSRLGLAVAIDPRGEAGAVTIRYKTLEQLDLVIDRLRGERMPRPPAD
jgi:ParB family transcriptional regulator, chromosome partitioning protein